MKKVFMSICWIVVLNGVFTELFVAFTMSFNPTITNSEAYEFGSTYGAGFFFLSVALVVYLVATNKLPGVRPRRSFP
ncbi:MAG: hypothetical protein V4631_22260 [Pseudomonadota bacterium]